MKASIEDIIKRRDPELDPAEFLVPNLKPYMAEFGAIRNLDSAARILIGALKPGSGSPRILVFGDYDADGICSVTAVSRLLSLFGRPDHNLMLPDRMTEGHGLSSAATTRLIEAKPDLVIVVDCGTTSQASLMRIAEVAKHGILVMDHHQAPGMSFPEMPDGVTLINPALDPFDLKRVGKNIARGLSQVCAGGLFYIFAAHFMVTWRACTERDFSGKPVDGSPDDDAMRSLLTDIGALAAMTTITDMARLTRFNRALVRACLPSLGRIPGIRAMARNFPFKLDPDAPRTSDVGFKYGPVVNAAGRIYHGNIALRLLLSADGGEIDDLAKQAIAVNEERKSVQKEVVAECLRQVDPDAEHGVIVRSDDFHPGVVGLAASRLLEQTGRPAVVIGTGGAASGRSIEGFDIGAFIHKAVDRKLILSGGGHTAAGGFRVPAEAGSHAALAKEFERATKGIQRIAAPPDIVIEFGQTIDLGSIYDALAPYGIGNPALVLLFKNPMFSDEKWFGKAGEGDERPHWRGHILNGKSQVEAVWFNARASRFWPAGRDSLLEARSIRGRLEEGSGFRGSSAFQIMVEAVVFDGQREIHKAVPTARPARAAAMDLGAVSF